MNREANRTKVLQPGLPAKESAIFAKMSHSTTGNSLATTYAPSLGIAIVDLCLLVPIYSTPLALKSHGFNFDYYLRWTIVRYCAAGFCYDFMVACLFATPQSTLVLM